MMDQPLLQGIGYISMASSNILPRPIFSPVQCNSIWDTAMINEADCPQQISLPTGENPTQPGTTRSHPQEPPSLADDPADAWFNAAGILLSLKHAAAERNARMGTPMDVPPSSLSEGDPTNAHPQVNILQPVNGFTTQNNGSIFLHSNGLAGPNDPECLQEFYSGHVPEEETVSDHPFISDDPGNKTNKCRLCDKMYARPSTLRTHMRTHSGEKPYQCHICMKSFSQDANLTAHLRIHSGEKPFKCSICDRRFAQSSSVTTHMRTHTGERPYRCKMCARGFADSSTLTKHLRTHTGEKPYKCKICQLKFSQSGNLNRHMRVHEHGE